MFRIRRYVLAAAITVVVAGEAAAQTLNRCVATPTTGLFATPFQPTAVPTVDTVRSQSAATGTPSGPAAMSFQWRFELPAFFGVLRDAVRRNMTHIDICVHKSGAECGQPGSLIYSRFSCQRETATVDAFNPRVPTYPDRSGIPNAHRQIRGILASVSDRTFTHVFEGQSLSWRVRACNGTNCSNWSNPVGFRWVLPAPMLFVPPRNNVIDASRVGSSGGYVMRFSRVVGADTYVICVQSGTAECANTTQFFAAFDAKYFADCAPGGGACGNEGRYVLQGPQAELAVRRFIDANGSGNLATGNWIVKACRFGPMGALDCPEESIGGPVGPIYLRRP